MNKKVELNELKKLQEKYNFATMLPCYNTLEIVAFIVNCFLFKLEATKYCYMETSAFSYSCFLSLSNERDM